MFASCTMMAWWWASHEDMEQEDQVESLSSMETTHTHGSSTLWTSSNHIDSKHRQCEAWEMEFLRDISGVRTKLHT